MEQKTGGEWLLKAPAYEGGVLSEQDFIIGNFGGSGRCRN